MPSMLTEPESAYETLMQFLYGAPIGLVQSALDGTIEMINPMSTSLLMPLSLTAIRTSCSWRSKLTPHSRSAPQFEGW